MTEDERLVMRIAIEALVSEREGMIAENQYRNHCGYTVAYTDKDFFENTNKCQALIVQMKKLAEK